MKHGTAINCIEFTGGNTYKAPPAADPNEPNLNLEVKVYKLNPDGSKGELIRTDPAYPEGWDNPRAILPQKPKKEEENIMIPRKDRDEIVATWLSKDEKQKEPKKNYFGTPIIEPKADNKLIPGVEEKYFCTDCGVEIVFPYTRCKPCDQFYMQLQLDRAPEPTPEPEPVNYSQAVNQLTLSFIFDIYDSDLAPVDKLGLIAKQIKVWEEL